jgi:hypothetical protein
MKRHASLFLCLVATIALAANKTEDTSSSDDFPVDIPVPEGEPVTGIKIPYYGEDGTTLQMVIEADVARRIDANTVEMTEMRIDANSDDGRKLFVQMPQSLFDIESRMLTGSNGVLIRREDFEITGKQGEFDIRKRFGKILGNVKMVVYSLEGAQ